MFLGDLEFFEKTEFSHHSNPKHKKSPLLSNEPTILVNH